MPEIAIVVYSKGDPIHVNTPYILTTLKRIGYDATIVDMDWANDDEWFDLVHATPTPGRHTNGWVETTKDNDYIVRWYEGPGGGFVRDHLRHDIELEEI